MLKKLFNDKAFLKTVWVLALPIILQNLISFSVSMTDTLMLGFVGKEEMAAATLANAAFFVISLVIFGFQSGESVMISQYWGKRDTKSISKILGVAWFCVLTVTISFALVAIAYPKWVMGLFSNEAHIIELGAQYVRAVAIAYPLNAFASIYISAHRCMENPKLGLYVFASSAIINVVINYLFIFGAFGFPKLGVVGAAVGTVAARVIETAIIIFYIIKNKHFRINFPALFKPGKEMLKDFVRYASPVIFNETLFGIGFSSLSAIYGRMGSDVVAAITICRNLESVLNVVTMGICNATVVIIGKQLGKGESFGIMDTAKKILTLTVLVSAVNSVLILLISRPVVSIFKFPEATNTIAFGAILVYSLRMIPMNFTMTMVVGILRGGGDTKAAMLIDLLPLWFLTIPLAWAIGLYFKLPAIWVFTPNLLEDIVKMSIGLKRFKSGLWINNITREIA